MNLNTLVLNKLALALLLGSAAAISANDWAALKTKATAGTLDAADYKTIVDNWGNRPSSFMEDLGENDMESILAKAAGIQVSQLDAWRTNQYVNRSNIKKIVSGIKGTELKKMSTDACGAVVKFLEYVKSSTDVPAECRDKYYTYLATDACDVTISHIPAKWVKEDGSKMIGAFGSESAKRIARLNKDSFKMLMENNDDVCKTIPASTLTMITADQRPLVKPSCVANMTNLGAEDLSKHVRLLPDNTFAMWNGPLADTTTAAITGEQLKKFASESDDVHATCHELDLSKVSKKAMKSITPECFIGSYSTSTPVGENLLNLPENTFKKYDEKNLDFVRHIDAADFQYLSSEVLQIIFNSEEAIKNLPDGVVYPKKRGVSVTTTVELFNMIAEKSLDVAGQMLITLAALPDNVLIDLSPTMIDGLSATNANETITYSGTEIMTEIVKTRPNYKSIISTMTQNANVHYCSTITSADDYLNKMPWLRGNCSDECRNALGFDTTDPAFVAEALEFNNDPEAYKIYLEKFTASEWSNVNDGLMSVLVKNKDFCVALTEESNKHIIPSLNDKALSAIGGECAKIIRKSITADNVSKFASNVFSHYGQIEFADIKMTLNEVSIAQFPMLSTEVAAGQSVFASLSEDEFKAINDEHIVAMSPKQWSAVTAKNVATLDETKMKLIQAHNMTLFTDAQLEVLSEPVLVAMTAEQISQVGKDSNATLAAFDKVTSKMDTAQTEALATRKAKPVVVTEEGSNMWIWIIIGVALLIGGVAVFFFVRK
ncbi:hypothetical protein PSACC_00102 [Paramicrosporidium saccamoebae]|uniref:Uncharacterized protein n=1 Tax=Paramicrosporidium saccamoebae TaxID=1246581 RepID=A0A2H9TQQ2_9FUNG|nr:hypothetical protein PSACC_00102 [Paramicrosporidium saccamoebae]